MSAPMLALAAALAAAPPALAQEPPEPTIVLRGSVEPEPQAEPPPLAPAPPPRRSDFPAADPVAPRMGGLAPTQTGGAACRTTCAKSYYFCLAQDEATSCGRQWSQCLSFCPKASGAE